MSLYSLSTDSPGGPYVVVDREDHLDELLNVFMQAGVICAQEPASNNCSIIKFENCVDESRVRSLLKNWHVYVVQQANGTLDIACHACRAKVDEIENYLAFSARDKRAAEDLVKRRVEVHLSECKFWLSPHVDNSTK